MIRSISVAFLGTFGTACSSGSPATGGSPADASSEVTTDAAASSTFGGQVTGTDAEVGLVVEGSKGFLFFCGGMTTFTTLTRWFRGDVSLGAPFTLTDMAWTVTGALQSDGMTVNGTINLGADAGPPLAWTASVVSSATVAGLYEANDADGMAALIVSQATPSDSWDGLGAFRTPAGSIQQVVPFSHVMDGFTSQVMVNGAAKQLLLTRAHAQ